MNRIRIAYFLAKVIIAFLLITSCINTDDYVTINVKVLGSTSDTITYYFSQKGLHAFPLWGYKRMGLDSNGYAQLNLETDEMNYLFIKTHGGYWRERANLLVRPGEEYEIVIDSEASQLVTINGDFSEGQQFYSESYITVQRLTFFGEFYSDTIPQEMLKILEDSIESRLQPLNLLYKNRKIDKQLYNAIKAEIEYSHLRSLMHILNIRSRVEEPERQGGATAIPINIYQEDYIDLFIQIFKKYPYDNTYAKLCNKYGDYLEQYVWLRSVNDNSLEYKISNKDSKIKYAKGILDYDLFEYFYAKQFRNISKEDLPEIAKSRFEDFKITFPESPFLPYISQSISDWESNYFRFYPSGLDSVPIGTIETKDSNEVISSTSLNEVISKYKGKVVFIDLWATWCPPCIEEFAYSKNIQEFADKHKIQLLYISLDDNEEKWINAIKKYGLMGDHLIAEDTELKKELVELAPTVPKYFIVNKDGEIVEYDAKRPSSGEELYEQLLQYVK